VEASLTTWNASSNRDRVREFLADGVGVAAEWVEGGGLDGHSELEAVVLEPVGVRGAASAFDGVPQSGVQTAVLVAGQVDHDCDRLVGGAQRGRPDVFIDSERLHSCGVLDPPGGSSVLIAFQAVCQQRCRAIAETVVSSCGNASMAHDIARAVSLDRVLA
jgi:hypothetical protein